VSERIKQDVAASQIKSGLAAKEREKET